MKKNKRSSQPEPDCMLPMNMFVCMSVYVCAHMLGKLYYCNTLFPGGKPASILPSAESNAVAMTEVGRENGDQV